jgi:hypothetical protein
MFQSTPIHKEAQEHPKDERDPRRVHRHQDYEEGKACPRRDGDQGSDQIDGQPEDDTPAKQAGRSLAKQVHGKPFQTTTVVFPNTDGDNKIRL